jgi:SAM-dependent methyltransferase
MASRKASFGEQRLVPGVSGAAERMVYRAMGVADPAHWLHFRYLKGMLDTLPFQPKRILDAGCERADFTYYLARRYPDARVLGVDIDRQFIERYLKVSPKMNLPNLEFELADLAAKKFADKFDLIVSIDVLEHIPDQAAALRNLREALAPGGRAFFHIPTVRERPVPFSSHLHAFHEWSEKEHVARDLTAAEFEEAVRNAGFTVLEARRTFGWWTGEMATSLFALPFRDSLRNRMFQAALALPCRLLAMADRLALEQPRFAVAITAAP